MVDDVSVLAIDRYPAMRPTWRAYEQRDDVTVHDAAYVALAEALRCALVTADAGPARASGVRCEVALVGRDR